MLFNKLREMAVRGLVVFEKAFQLFEKIRGDTGTFIRLAISFANSLRKENPNSYTHRKLYYCDNFHCPKYRQSKSARSRAFTSTLGRLLLFQRKNDFRRTTMCPQKTLASSRISVHARLYFTVELAEMC